MGTVTGGWVIEDYYHFRGKKYTAATHRSDSFTIDSDGRLDARFTIPEDYGGVHDVIAPSMASRSRRTASKSRRASR